MPRKTKEVNEIKKEKNQKISTQKTAKSKTSSKNTTTKKNISKTTAVKSSNSIKKTSKKITPKKVSTSTKKATTKKSKKEQFTEVEYYDLPYNYNQTVVKLLAQTPTSLFVYWEISERDRENYKKSYGDNFFETTKPILKIYNDTMNYNFEIEINDFANSWYIHVNDSKCNYRVELGRRFINNKITNENYVYVSSSNEIQSPNDRILFDQIQTTITFKNIKTNVETQKDISTIRSISNISKIYNIYDLYKEFYKNENIDELSNPSSSYKGEL
ncbi:MAG: DUF4912 domain-containing protein [Clostridia bacterium]|nr:DUF4912 domain-containing protein [Clostridia bacterium]